MGRHETFFGYNMAADRTYDVTYYVRMSEGRTYKPDFDPTRRHGYTSAGVARRAKPAHRLNGFWTYRDGKLTFYVAYDQVTV